MSRHPNIWELFDLRDKVFLVAGGARHLGRDMAVALAEAHGNGVITSRNLASAELSASELSEQTGQSVVGLALDASDEQQIEKVVTTTFQKFDRIDILVNCVGGGACVTDDEAVNLEDRRLEDWQRLCTANLTAPFLLCKHVVPIMRKQGCGSIINIGSSAGLVGRDRRVYGQNMKPQTIDYGAFKGGVINMTRDMAAYLGNAGIRVNAISPGGFKRRQPKEFIEAYSDKCILRRMGKDGVDLKGAAVYLASEASAYVTGHNLVVDGGFTAWQ